MILTLTSRTRTSTSQEKSKKTVKVLNKNGNPAGYTQRNKAESSVKSDKSRWVDKDTIQILYHHEDEQSFKREAWKRDNYTCYLCGEEMYEDHPELTVDHIVPRRSGGSILPKNLSTCCRTCNGQKGWRSYDLYFRHLYLGLSFLTSWWSKRGDRFNDGGDHQEEKEEEKENNR